jgi:hypothetical protein
MRERIMRAWIVACVMLTCAAAQALPASIGAATMAKDGTITLRLRAEGPGMTGDGMLIYKPGDARYGEVERHIGGIKPGQTKPVPPWKD